jgi:hypothetical protein
MQSGSIPLVLSATVIASLNHKAYSDSPSDLAVVLPNLVEDPPPVADLLDIVAVTRVHHPHIAPLHLADSCRALVSTPS